tara:strand:- start:4677 stop:5108 length:432 start_codon:yes stop_codon:yes gene_type:complete
MAYSNTSTENRIGLLGGDQYLDIDLSFKRNPITNDVMMKKNVNAVNQSLRNLLLTNRFERQFSPSFGGNIYNSLFEPQDEFTARDLEDRISKTITNFEKRVQIVGVSVEYPELYQNSAKIQVVYVLIATDEEVTTTFTIERVR